MLFVRGLVDWHSVFYPSVRGLTYNKGGVKVFITTKEKLKDAIKEIQEEEKIEKEREKCEHKELIIYGYSMLGTIVCKKCGKTFPLFIGLNNLFDRLYNLEKRLSEKC